MDEKKQVGDEHGENCSCGKSSTKESMSNKENDEVGGEVAADGPNLGDASESDNKSQDEGKVYNV